MEYFHIRSGRLSVVVMFSRRHPYLFFLLIFISIISITTIGVTIMIVAMGDDERLTGEKVGIIEITGAISDSKVINHQLKEFREAEAIKAIVLRIDSPGGGVGPSQEIYTEILKTVEEKTVIASMGSVAASGGYYVAAAANGIVANPGTITGSIGVIMGYTNFQRLLETIGLVPIVIKSGEYKDMGSPAREMTQKEKDLLQNLIKNIHEQFVSAIAEGRDMEKSEVTPLADGRIFTGEEALTLGLVDKLGNLEDAVDWAGQLGGIKGEIETVYAEEEDLPLLKYLLTSSLNNLVNHITNSNLNVDYRFDPANN